MAGEIRIFQREIHNQPLLKTEETKKTNPSHDHVKGVVLPIIRKSEGDIENNDPLVGDRNYKVVDDKAAQEPAATNLKKVASAAQSLSKSTTDAQNSNNVRQNNKVINQANKLNSQNQKVLELKKQRLEIKEAMDKIDEKVNHLHHLKQNLSIELDGLLEDLSVADEENQSEILEKMDALETNINEIEDEERNLGQEKDFCLDEDAKKESEIEIIQRSEADNEITTEEVFSDGSNKVLEQVNKSIVLNESLETNQASIVSDLEHARIKSEITDVLSGKIDINDVSEDTKAILMQASLSSARLKQINSEIADLLSGKIDIKDASHENMEILKLAGCVKMLDDGSYQLIEMSEEEIRQFIENIQEHILNYYALNPKKASKGEEEEEKIRMKVGAEEGELGGPDGDSFLDEINGVTIGKQDEIRLQNPKKLINELQKLLEEQNKIKSEREHRHNHEIAKKDAERTHEKLAHIKHEHRKYEDRVKENKELDIKADELEVHRILEILQNPEVFNATFNNIQGLALVETIKTVIKFIPILEKIPHIKKSPELKTLMIQVVSMILTILPAIGVNATEVDANKPGKIIIKS